MPTDRKRPDPPPMICPACQDGKHGEECFEVTCNVGAVDYLDFGHYCDCREGACATAGEGPDNASH